jgi:AraC-like DNA-binding protein
MAHAEYLLLETDFQISQIAKAVGYNHAGRFSSLFQKNTGLLPEEYRRVIKK